MCVWGGVVRGGGGDTFFVLQRKSLRLGENKNMLQMATLGRCRTEIQSPVF